MHPAVYLIAPLALLGPAFAAFDRAPHAGLTAEVSQIAAGPISRPLEAGAPEPWQSTEAGQIRIEQHITIRIGPGPGSAASALQPSALAELDEPSAPAAPPRLVEHKFGKCVAANGIAGSQPGPGNRLILYLRDSRVLTANLGRRCNARDFYSGFLVHGTPDGMICAGRDSLLSRNGANCKLGGLRQLVETGE